VHRLLTNAIYAGVFTWQGSGFCRAKARRSGRTLQPKVFARPELRLVDDETWRICNDRGFRPHRGGRRHLLAGLLSCGACGATLTIKVAGGRESAYCASCASAKAVGVNAAFLGYVSTIGVREALEHVLRHMFSEAAVQAFRQRLTERLSQSREQEREQLVRLLQQATRACERLARHMRDQPEDDPIIDRQYREAAAERLRLEQELRALDASQPSEEERAAAQRQLHVDPLAVLSRLLRGEGDVERTQAVLGRLFPRIALVARPARYVAIYEIEVAPAVGFAVAADGKAVLEQREVLKVEVGCSAHRPTRWVVRILEHTSK
jgi:hypothetical protein